MTSFFINILKKNLRVDLNILLRSPEVWPSQLDSSDLIKSIFKPIWNENRLESHSRSTGYRTNLLGMINNYDLESKVEIFKHVYFLKIMKLHMEYVIFEKLKKKYVIFETNTIPLSFQCTLANLCSLWFLGTFVYFM